MSSSITTTAKPVVHHPHQPPAPSSPHHVTGGSLHGVPVTVVHKPPPPGRQHWHSQAASIQAPDQKPLAQRAVQREGVPQLLPNAQIVEQTRLNALGLAPRKDALNLLRNGQWPRAQAGNRRSVTGKLAALQTAAKYLDEDEDGEGEGDSIGLLMPIAGLPGNADDLSEQLSQSHGDARALYEMLKEDEELAKIPADKLYLELKGVLDKPNPRGLADKLKQLMGLPRDKKARRELRQKVHDELRAMDLPGSAESSQIRATLNATPTAREADDPAGFLDEYSELLHKTGNFAEALKYLVDRHGVEKLRNVLAMKIKALGDDLRAARPSRFPRDLEVILTNLSSVYLSQTWLEKITDFVADLARVRRVSARA